jgi:predicted Ser/Thr protein kinase
MTPEPAGRIRQLFAEALKLPSSERSAFLIRSCGSDRDLLAAVESLLSESKSTKTSILGAGLRISQQPTVTNAFDPAVASPRNHSMVGTRLKERYLLQRELGRGGFGVVYLAADEQLLSRPIVVKIMLNAAPDAWEQGKFRNEIEVLARLNHPGIVSVLDSGETAEGRPFLAMEYVEGTPLRALLRREGMDLERVADLIRQIGGALGAAHRKGIWHRDLKPENIMIQSVEDGDQRVKLIDFGLATVKRSDALVDSTTRIAGTIRYMAPEQLRRRPSAASDIYGLAVIAYEMVTGRLPFNAETALELYEMQMAGVQVRPKSLRPRLPEEAESSILKALQPAEGDRHPTIGAFVQELVQGLRTAKGPAGFIMGERDPHFGRLVAKMCDRRSQEDEFRGFLARSAMRHPGLVVFCLVHGDEGECHESLVERLAYDAELLARKRESEEKPSVKIVKIPWQYEGTPEIRLRRLVAWLFERFGTEQGVRLDDTSPAALAALLASSFAPFVFLQHDIRASRWDNLTKSLIRSYRSYLAEVPRTLAGPQIIVCLNVIYPHGHEGEGRLLFKPKALVRNMMKMRIRKDLAEIAGMGAYARGSQAGLCLLLDELKPITRMTCWNGSAFTTSWRLRTSG